MKNVKGRFEKEDSFENALIFLEKRGNVFMTTSQNLHPRMMKPFCQGLHTLLKRWQMPKQQPELSRNSPNTAFSF